MAGAPGPAELVDRAGLGAADRAAAIDGLSRVRPITAGQRLQLDELLAESGRDVLGVGTPIDPAVVAAGVTGSGELNTLDTTAAPPDAAPSYFTLSTGRLELTDARAVFFPGDGQPAVRAVAYALPDLPDVAGAAPPPLSDDAIRSTLRAIARLNGNRPKQAQVQAILMLLRGVGQQVVVPTTDGSDPATEVTAVQTDPDGNLTIQTAHAGTTCELTVTPACQVSASLVTPAMAAAVAAKPLNQAAMDVFGVTAAAQLALAVYLLVIGILTVRRSRLGRVLHWIFVGLKVPLAVLASWAAWSVTRELNTGGAGWWATPSLLGLIYPIALIFVLCGRSARDYYGPADLTSAGTRSAPW